MRVVQSLPHEVREIDHTWITMPDGVRLSAKIWLPDSAEREPVPAILEYIPYRKRDWTSLRDSITHPYLAGHGYASVRVDLRGSGDSEGVLRGEYLEQELADGEAVLEWIAAQPWCSGAVAMLGISWGGFNGLQLAARQSPALKTIITVCSTDDRYADDVHYMGGCMLGDNLSWASTMFSYTSSPPDPAIVGERWRAMWFERLTGSGLWLEDWLTHQRRDEFWKHGSVCEDFSAIRIPVMAVSGWADAYSNSVFRLLEHLDVPRQGLVGPWSHKYPHLGVPGPAIGFLQEALRWFDHWLKGIETGIMNEPMLRVFLLDSAPPSTGYEIRHGRWVAEPSWPSPSIKDRCYRLAERRLLPADAEVPEHALPIHSPLSLGQFAGKWCASTAPPDLPDDQREEDGGALVFDTDPLPEALEILGAPVVELDLASNRPIAMIAVRLSDILPDGKVTRVTYGLLNLTHRDSHEHPEPLEPGKRYRVRVQLNDFAQHFPADHRIRVAISTSYWPLAWPPPQPVTLTIFTGHSRLVLPERPLRTTDGSELADFPGPEGTPELKRTLREPPEGSWKVIRDLARDASCVEVIVDRGLWRWDAIDWEAGTRAEETYFVRHDDLNSLKGETRWVRRFRRGDWSTETITRTILTSTPDAFQVYAELDAYEGNYRVYSANWDRSIRRDHL